MGVFELENFIKKNLKTCIKSVSVEAEIEEFTRNHSGQKPILIFDCFSIVSLLSVNKSEILCAGRHQVYSEILDDLFSRLSKNAELIFFLDGFIMKRKFETWASRQNHKFNISNEIMSMVYHNFPLNDIVRKYAGNIYTNTLLSVIESSCHKFGRLHYTVNSECDQEIARFAYKNQRVLGVFSKDTDFLIFSGSWRYFSTPDINLKTLKTIEFDRKLLRNYLKLSGYQMAIFATAAGNDIISHYDLVMFHNKFGHKLNQKLPAIAEYVKKNFSRLQLKDSSKLQTQLAKDMFGSLQQKSHIMYRIEASLNSYNVHSNDSWNYVNSLNFYLHENHIFTFNILNESPINFSLVFFDCCQRDMPNSYIGICAEMFQRQAGIVLVNSSTPNANLTVYTKPSFRKKYTKVTFRSIHPPFKVPLLEELFSNDPQFDDIRFTLLKWTIDWEKLKDYDLHAIPSNYMIDVLTITFMVQKKIIWSKEADIILWTINNVENKTIPKIIKPPSVLNSRAFRIAFLYVKLFVNVARSIEVCGLKKIYWKPLNFDGVFFHNEYQRLMSQDFNTETLLDGF